MLLNHTYYKAVEFAAVLND